MVKSGLNSFTNHCFKNRGNIDIYTGYQYYSYFQYIVNLFPRKHVISPADFELATLHMITLANNGIEDSIGETAQKKGVRVFHSKLVYYETVNGIKIKLKFPPEVKNFIQTSYVDKFYGLDKIFAIFNSGLIDFTKK